MHTSLGAVFALLSFFAAAPGRAEVLTRTVEYRQGETVLEGYLAYDAAGPAKRPGVLVVHEWTGSTRTRASGVEQLAALGYVAFAADIYGKGVRPATPKEAAATAGQLQGRSGAAPRAGARRAR